MVHRAFGRLCIGIAALLAGACQQAAPAPPPAAPPSSAIRDSLKQQFDQVKGYLLLAVDQTPAATFAFHPTPEVRTFGQIIGHLANVNYSYCSTVSGAKAPDTDFQTVTSKADLQKALTAALTFCDQAFAGLTDRLGEAPSFVPQFNYSSTKLGMLAANTAHNNEHYGNIVTYLRLNHLVPPSSRQSGSTIGR